MPVLASAQSSSESFTLRGVLYDSGVEGSIMSIDQYETPTEFIGRTCEMSFESYNDSVHPGNDLIVTTGGVEYLILGSEDATDGIETAKLTIELGATISLALRFGPDQVTSTDFQSTIDCTSPVVETTTTMIDCSTTTTPTTVVPSTTVPSTTIPGGGGITETTADPTSTIVLTTTTMDPGCPTTTTDPSLTTTTVEETTTTDGPATSSPIVESTTTTEISTTTELVTTTTGPTLTSFVVTPVTDPETTTTTEATTTSTTDDIDTTTTEAVIPPTANVEESTTTTRVEVAGITQSPNPTPKAKAVTGNPTYTG